MPSIAVVVGSTRPQRICRGIAQWVLGITKRDSLVAYELVDLAHVALPFLDEPLMASLGHYEHEHTKRWSRIVSRYDGFVFVMPQYNWGYTAALKNALDFLYAEWHGKAAATVTYGSHGGGKGADQLAVVLAGLGMRQVSTNPRLTTPPDRVGAPNDVGDVDLAPFEPAVRAMAIELAALIGAR